jgi:hypothetical protein
MITRNKKKILLTPLSFPIRWASEFISFVFHPLFVASYVSAFLIFVHPSTFAGFDHSQKVFRFISIFFSSCFLPFFSIFLCRRLGFVQSIYLKTTRDRIIPYAIVMIFYFWIWYVFKNQPDNPAPAVRLLLGCFLAVCGGWMCNIYFKISMHAIAAGGLVAFAILFSLNEPYASGTYMSVAVLVAGLICTARFLVSDHSPKDIYSGLGIGMLAQLIAWMVSS